MTMTTIDEQISFEEESSFNWSSIWVLASIIFFTVTKYGLSSFVPKEVISQGPVTTWKWLNIANSLLHSFVTGLGSLLCFYFYPQLAADVVRAYSLFSHVLVAFSTGYFVHDFFDMLFNHRKRSSYELMVHHSFVVCCFSLSILTRYYLGYAVVALLVEVNSVFLHWRQLLLLKGVPKSDILYRKVSLFNLATFVVFRLVTFGWMTRWLALNGDQVPFSVYVLGCVAMTTFTAMSTVLFFRLLRADFHSTRKQRQQHDKSN